jgi:hypothetical protein
MPEPSPAPTYDTEREAYIPETPTTIYDGDVGVSPDEPPAPNILVLASDNRNSRWTSASSTLSGYSQSSHNSSSTVVSSADEDMKLTRYKILLVKAAMNAGFQRGQGQTLNAFVKSLSSNAFGSAPWQISLLENYKNLVLNDPGLRAPANLPPRRAMAPDIARAVLWMMKTTKYSFLRDLYRLVFGFHIEEAELRQNVAIQT